AWPLPCGRRHATNGSNKGTGYVLSQEPEKSPIPLSISRLHIMTGRPEASASSAPRRSLGLGRVETASSHCQSHPFEVRPIIPILLATTTALTRSSVYSFFLARS